QPQTIDSNKIFIGGLPTSMPEQVLFDKLRNVFLTVGKIKINRTTDKPWIVLFRQKDNKSQLSGNACITFEEEESVIEAIKKYHQKCVPALNNAHIDVQKYKVKNEETIGHVIPMPPKSLSAVRESTGQPNGPVNIFWDIENVAVPARHNAFNIALNLQKMLIDDRDRTKGNFTVYCNTKTISDEHQKGLSNAGVKIQHVPNGKPGTVDQHILMALPGVQPPGPLLSSAGDLTKNGDLFYCLECDKKFPTNAARVQHQQDKHKIGELIQLSANGGQPENDLIAFGDGDDYGLSQASSLSAKKETISLIDLEDDSENADEGEWENLSASDKDDDDDVDDMNDSENGDEDVGSAILCLTISFLFGLSNVNCNAGGIVQKDWETLRALFEQNFQNNVDLGASLAVYHRGKLVVNLWGGWFDKQKTKSYDNDTLQLIFSTLKGPVAMTIALCVQRGLLSYTGKVIKYWLEYGQSDKENKAVAEII
ncbi:unnamed protein product, partial [Rotaria magnacalcarata]